MFKRSIKNESEEVKPIKNESDEVKSPKTESKKVNEIYNIGSGKEIQVNYIAKLIGGKKIYIPKRPGEPNRSLADISKIKKELNWKPSISIEEGVKNLLSIIHNWKNAPVWTPKSIKKETKTWFKLLDNK